MTSNLTSTQSVPRVLVVAQYPCVVPSHGGQVRLKGIVDAMASMGLHVRTMGVYADFQFPADQRGPYDLVIVDNEFNEAYFQDPLFGDVLSTHFVMQRPMLIKRIADAIASFSPDFIWMEQPFVAPLIEHALEAVPNRPKVILSSANEEVRLKYLLADMPNCVDVLDVTMFDRAAEIETMAQKSADLIVCISDEEAEKLKAAGIAAYYLPATSPMSFPPMQPQAKLRAKDKRPAPYIAYAASSYWPNVEGFFEMFPDGLGFLKPNERIRVAGSVCEALAKDKRFDARRSINESRMDLLGFVPAAELVSLYQEAEAVIVPITTGAGANLKMADALASGRPVISTTTGIEGFRSLINDALEDGVYEADDSLGFRKLCRLGIERRLRAPKPGLAQKFLSETTQGKLVDVFSLASAQ